MGRFDVFDSHDDISLPFFFCVFFLIPFNLFKTVLVNS